MSLVLMQLMERRQQGRRCRGAAGQTRGRRRLDRHTQPPSPPPYRSTVLWGRASGHIPPGAQPPATTSRLFHSGGSAKRSALPQLVTAASTTSSSPQNTGSAISECTRRVNEPLEAQATCRFAGGGSDELQRPPVLQDGRLVEALCHGTVKRWQS